MSAAKDAPTVTPNRLSSAHRSSNNSFGTPNRSPAGQSQVPKQHRVDTPKETRPAGASGHQTEMPRGTRPGHQSDTPRGTRPAAASGHQIDTPRGSRPTVASGHQTDTPKRPGFAARAHDQRPKTRPSSILLEKPNNGETPLRSAHPSPVVRSSSTPLKRTLSLRVSKKERRWSERLADPKTPVASTYQDDFKTPEELSHRMISLNLETSTAGRPPPVDPVSPSPSPSSQTTYQDSFQWPEERPESAVRRSTRKRQDREDTPRAGSRSNNIMFEDYSDTRSSVLRANASTARTSSSSSGPNQVTGDIDSSPRNVPASNRVTGNKDTTEASSPRNRSAAPSKATNTSGRDTTDRKNNLFVLIKNGNTIGSSVNHAKNDASNNASSSNMTSQSSSEYTIQQPASFGKRSIQEARSRFFGDMGDDSVSIKPAVSSFDLSSRANGTAAIWNGEKVSAQPNGALGVGSSSVDRFGPSPSRFQSMSNVHLGSHYPWVGSESDRRTPGGRLANQQSQQSFASSGLSFRDPGPQTKETPRSARPNPQLQSSCGGSPFVYGSGSGTQV